MEGISVEKAQQILQDSGLSVSIEQAATILEILSTLANIAISVYLISDD
jgi:hypothetical protein